MASRLDRAIEQVLQKATGREACIVAQQAVTGGCIHQARIVELHDGGRFFVKSSSSSSTTVFEREAEGLRALASVGVLRVPEVVGFGGGGDMEAFLLTEAISLGSPGPHFQEEFGEALARHHRTSSEAAPEAFGFSQDNHLGSTPQPNGWCDVWVDFWRRHRLGHQLRLARRAGLGSDELHRLGERLMDHLDDFLSHPDEAPCLLHGDLWGGNYLVDEAGTPVLIDPAAYYGRREADLAMTRLFGGFGPSFQRAYEAAWPLASGSEQRLAIYELYHLLNHLNLFGESYHGSCLSRLRSLEG